MAKVHVVNVSVLENPSTFLSKFQFEITFECVEDLQEVCRMCFFSRKDFNLRESYSLTLSSQVIKHVQTRHFNGEFVTVILSPSNANDLEWKIIYVGSAESEEYDQTLDTVYVGPVPEGRHLFVFEADPPDATKIPNSELVGVTVVLVTCSYKGQEFVRVGYYVNNAYSDPEMQENPPDVPKLDAVNRNILASQPRVTKFKIDWDDAKETENIPPPNENTSMDATNTTASTNTTNVTNSTNSISLDPIKATLLESSNSASAMEVS